MLVDERVGEIRNWEKIDKKLCGVVDEQQQEPRPNGEGRARRESGESQVESDTQTQSEHASGTNGARSSTETRESRLGE